MESVEQTLINFVRSLTKPYSNIKSLESQAEFTAERSYGNYDDCFEDGMAAANAIIALDARTILNNLNLEVK